MKYFETIRCDDFEVFNLEYHNRRIAKTIGLNLNLQEYIYPPNSKLLRCKVIYDDSGILDVEYFPYKKREIKSFKIIEENSINYKSKYLERTNIDELFAKKEDCDEIIIVKNGIVSDTSIANIAIFYKGKWITSKQYLLEGTTRQRYLDDSRLVLKDISIEMIKKSDKIALLNAMIDFDILEDFSIYQ